LSFGILEADPVDLSADVPANAPLLWMTGSGELDLGPEQTARLKKYLQNGGTLFVDSTAGIKAFADSAESLLKGMFGADGVKEMPANYPLLTGEFGGGVGTDLRELKYTREGARIFGTLREQPLYGVEVNGRLAVIFSKAGVTCGVEGLPTYGCAGLSVDDARRLAANVVLYALLGQ